MTFGNGVVLTKSHDQDYELSGIAAVAGATSIQNLAYTPDASGNIITITDSVTPPRSQSIGYDDLNRVQAASGPYGSQSYLYDATGNRTQRVIGPNTYIYAIDPASNRINTITNGSNVRSFSYLPTGQVANDNRTPSSAYVYNYNNIGRLASATSNGTTVGTYLVNGLEQRVAKTGPSSTTHYIYDRLGHLLEEADGTTGAVQREYIWLEDVPVAVVNTTGAIFSTYYIHTDHIGALQKLTDASANVVWDAVFDPFGNLSPIVSPLVMNLRFPGQYFDPEIGLNQSWNRDYDPSIGRYVESDPADRGGSNTYAYALNNPLSFLDWNCLEVACGSYYCGSNIPYPRGGTAPPSSPLSPATKAYICSLVAQCNGDVQCVFTRANAARKSDLATTWNNPTYRQAENWAYAAGWNDWQSWTISIYAWQYHKLLPGTSTTPFSQEALNAGLDGQSHQGDSPNDLKRWCNGCKK